MKTQIISLSLPRPLMKTVDSFSEARGMSRSDLFRSAVLRYLEGERWRDIQKTVRTHMKRRLPRNEDEIERIVDSVRR